MPRARGGDGLRTQGTHWPAEGGRPKPAVICLSGRTAVYESRCPIALLTDRPIYRLPSYMVRTEKSFRLLQNTKSFLVRLLEDRERASRLITGQRQSQGKIEGGWWCSIQ